MKVSFIILLCFALIFGIFAGCIGTNTPIDPIVGSWNYPNSDPAKSLTANFIQNGQIFASIPNYKEVLVGNWIKNQDNTYNIYTFNGISTDNSTFVFDKNTDTLYDQMYPEVIYYRITGTQTITQTTPVAADTGQGGFNQYCSDTYPGHTYDPYTQKCVLSSTTPTKTPTQPITATPTQDNYQYCRDTYPGSSYNPSMNKCVYPNTVPTKTPTRTQTQIVKNDIANAKFCFLKALATSDRDQFPSDPPLVHEGFWAVASSSTFNMPIKPGKYNILLTTLNPEATVDLYISYDNFTMKDKFGNSVYRRDKFLIGSSNRYTDLNQDINIPADSVNGIINIYQPTEYWLHNDNCGRLIVRAI